MSELSESPLGSSSSKSYSSRQNTITGNPINEKVKSYERIRRVTQILFGLFLITGAAYLVVVIAGRQTSYNDIKIGDNVSCSPDGKIVVLSLLKENKRSVLVSTDSGKHFTIEGGPWEVKDSVASLLITPDSKSIVVTDGSNHYYVSDTPFKDFSQYNISPSTTNNQYSIKGAFYTSKSRNIYLYGSMPDIVSFSLNIPAIQKKFPLPNTGYTIQSLAVNSSETEAKAIGIRNNNASVIWSIPLYHDSYNNSLNLPNASPEVDTSATMKDTGNMHIQHDMKKKGSAKL